MTDLARDFQATKWHSLQPDQIRALGLDLVRQLEVQKLQSVLDLAQQDGMYAATDDEAELNLLIEQMKASERLISTYDIRIAAVLGAIPPDAAP